MQTSETSGPAESSLARDLWAAARYYLGGRRGLLVLAALVLAAGLAFNWSWLVAAGLAPLLLGLLPCAAMCAFGLCMNKAAGRSCSSETPARESAKKMADQGLRAPMPADTAELPAEDIPTGAEPIVLTGPASSSPVQTLEPRRIPDA